MPRLSTIFPVYLYTSRKSRGANVSWSHCNTSPGQKLAANKICCKNIRRRSLTAAIKSHTLRRYLAYVMSYPFSLRLYLRGNNCLARPRQISGNTAITIFATKTEFFKGFVHYLTRFKAIIGEWVQQLSNWYWLGFGSLPFGIKLTPMWKMLQGDLLRQKHITGSLQSRNRRFPILFRVSCPHNSFPINEHNTTTDDKVILLFSFLQWGASCSPGSCQWNNKVNGTLRNGRSATIRVQKGKRVYSMCYKDLLVSFWGLKVASAGFYYLLLTRSARSANAPYFFWG